MTQKKTSKKADQATATPDKPTSTPKGKAPTPPPTSNPSLPEMENPPPPPRKKQEVESRMYMFDGDELSKRKHRAQMHVKLSKVQQMVQSLPYDKEVQSVSDDDEADIHTQRIVSTDSIFSAFGGAFSEVGISMLVQGVTNVPSSGVAVKLHLCDTETGYTQEVDLFAGTLGNVNYTIREWLLNTFLVSFFAPEKVDFQHLKAMLDAGEITVNEFRQRVTECFDLEGWMKVMGETFTGGVDVASQEEEETHHEGNEPGPHQKHLERRREQLAEVERLRCLKGRTISDVELWCRMQFNTAALNELTENQLDVLIEALSKFKEPTVDDAQRKAKAT